MTNLQSTYDNLMETTAKRQAKLEESIELFVLLEGVEEFKQWVAERQSVLIIDELGNNTEEAMVNNIVHWKWLAHPLPRHGEKSGYATENMYSDYFHT